VGKLIERKRDVFLFYAFPWNPKLNSQISFKVGKDSLKMRERFLGADVEHAVNSAM
jgi:hypothetical protein